MHDVKSSCCIRLPEGVTILTIAEIKVFDRKRAATVSNAFHVSVLVYSDCRLQLLQATDELLRPTAKKFENRAASHGAVDWHPLNSSFTTCRNLLLKDRSPRHPPQCTQSA